MPIGSASAAARPAGWSRCSPPRPARPSGRVRPAPAAAAGTARWSSITRPKTLVFAELEALHEAGLPILRAVGGAGRDRLRRRRRAGDHRPDRRLAQRQARTPPPRPVARGRRRRRRWPTWCSASSTISGPGGVVGAPRRGRVARRRAARRHAAASAALATARLEVVGIESADPRWVAAAIGSCAVLPTGCGRWARSPPRCVRSPPRGLTAWCPCGAREASTPPAAQLIVREAGGLVSFPAFDDPLGAPLDATPSSPVVAARTPETLHRA